MPYVTCPTCGERGKIPPNLVGARIKCRKCGLSFMVAGPSAGAKVGGVGRAGSTPVALAVAEPLQGGIEVEGLDASSWAVPTETASGLKAEAVADPSTRADAWTGLRSPSSRPQARGSRGYRLLTPRRQNLRRQVRPRPTRRSPEPLWTPGLDRQGDVDSAHEEFQRCHGGVDRRRAGAVMNRTTRSVEPPAGITTLDLLLFTAGFACGWAMHQGSALRTGRVYILPVMQRGYIMRYYQLRFLPKGPGGFHSLLGMAWAGWLWAFVIGLAFLILGRRLRYDGRYRCAEWLPLVLAIVLFESVYPAFWMDRPIAAERAYVAWLDPSSAAGPRITRVRNYMNSASLRSGRPLMDDLWWPRKGESWAEHGWMAARLAAAAATIAIAGWHFRAKLGPGPVAVFVFVIGVLVTLGPIRLAEATSTDFSSSARNPAHQPSALEKPWSWPWVAAYFDAWAWGGYTLRALALMALAMLAARSLLTRWRFWLWTEWAALAAASIMACFWLYDEFVARPALDRTVRVMLLGTWLLVIAIIAGVSIFIWGAISRRFGLADATGDHRSG